MNIEISVVAGDAFVVDADVLVVKYAQRSYGLDRAIIRNIVSEQVAADLPTVGDHRLVTELQNIKARSVLFVGVEPLRDFGYPQIRDFARRSLAILRATGKDVQHVVLTLHGAGYGLDEGESFESEVAGLLDAVTTGDFPAGLRQLSIIEGDLGRAARLSEFLSKLVPSGRINGIRGNGMSDLPVSSQQTLRTAGYAAASKPHVFVAMPFAPEFDDLYHYGIQGAVNRAGFLCERADLSSFTGDVMAWVRSRIGSARFLIAELTGANPNVYLEVGYAWALKIPTILIVEDSAHLRFDVRGQRTIDYKKSIRKLEELLAKELHGIVRTE